jgi:mannose-1-phosphate guanylyltransferase
LLKAMARYLPELNQGLARLTEDASRETLARINREFPNISLDHGIMEQADNVALVPVEMDWNDVGTWGALKKFSLRFLS